MWNKIKAFASKTWNSLRIFIMRHLHKVIAVTGAGAVAVTIEVLGFFAADYLLLPLAMTSIIGLMGLCFAYFCIVFAAVAAATEVFTFLWDKTQFNAESLNAIIQDTKNLGPSDHSTDAEMAAEMAGVKA